MKTKHIVFILRHLPYRLYAQMCVHFRVHQRILDQLAHLLKDARYPPEITVPGGIVKGFGGDVGSG